MRALCGGVFLGGLSLAQMRKRLLARPPPWLGIWLAVVVALVLSGCEGPPRSAVTPESALLDQLGFIRGDRVGRATVEARLGVPGATYEGGLVVSYTLFYSQGRFSLDSGPAGSECYALMIQYSQDGLIARHSLVHQGSVACSKG
jgi:hypothetical protein